MAHLAAALCLGGEHAEAMRTAQRALALVQELGGSRRIESEVHNALGLVLRHLGEPARSVAAHLRALELATSSEYRYGIARSHVNLVHALAADGRLAEALRHARVAHDLASRSGFGEFESLAATALADLT
jgi:tetratricopeptide (TPR) repeat protein